jgi:hypothetical protein
MAEPGTSAEQKACRLWVIRDLDHHGGKSLNVRSAFNSDHVFCSLAVVGYGPAADIECHIWWPWKNSPTGTKYALNETSLPETTSR